MNILRLFRRIFRSRKTKRSSSSFNYDNLLNSMFNGDQLYKELAKKCHPDRYPDKLKEKANDLFQMLQKRKFDIEGMNNLREPIESLYNSKIN